MQPEAMQPAASQPVSCTDFGQPQTQRASLPPMLLAPPLFAVVGTLVAIYFFHLMKIASNVYSGVEL